MLPQTSPTRRRDPSSGAMKPLGVLAAMLTAGAVFGLGLLVLPSVEPDAPAVTPAPAPPPPPPAPPPAPPEPPAVEAGAPPTPGTGLDADAAPSIQNPPIPPPKPVADATARKTKPEAKPTVEPVSAPATKPVVAPATKPVVAPATKPVVVAATKPAAEPATKPVAEPATKPVAEPTTKPAAEPTTKPAAEPATKPVAEPTTKPAAKPAAEVSHDKLADKDVARDAWRKNLPDISPEPGKAAMLIPIKGPIDGATYHVTLKPRSVLITLPKAESMITMPFYSVRHDGFRQLWIKKDEATGSTTIRVVLGEASDPQVEIKDDFVRVTVRRPAPESATAAPGAPSAGAAPTPSPAPAEAPGKPGPAPGGD